MLSSWRLWLPCIVPLLAQQIPVSTAGHVEGNTRACVHLFPDPSSKVRESVSAWAWVAMPWQGRGMLVTSGAGGSREGQGPWPRPHAVRKGMLRRCSECGASWLRFPSRSKFWVVCPRVRKSPGDTWVCEGIDISFFSLLFGVCALSGRSALPLRRLPEGAPLSYEEDDQMKSELSESPTIGDSSRFHRLLHRNDQRARVLERGVCAGPGAVLALTGSVQAEQGFHRWAVRCKGHLSNISPPSPPPGARAYVP